MDILSKNLKNNWGIWRLSMSQNHFTCTKHRPPSPKQQKKMVLPWHKDCWVILTGLPIIHCIEFQIREQKLWLSHFCNPWRKWTEPTQDKSTDKDKVSLEWNNQNVKQMARKKIKQRKRTCCLYRIATWTRHDTFFVLIEEWKKFHNPLQVII